MPDAPFDDDTVSVYPPSWKGKWDAWSNGQQIFESLRKQMSTWWNQAVMRQFRYMRERSSLWASLFLLHIIVSSFLWVGIALKGTLGK